MISFFSSIILILSLTIFLKSVYFHPFHWGKSCIPQEVEFRDKDFLVQAEKYEAKGSFKKNLLIMPPTGGVNFLDRQYAMAFCKAGFNAYILKKWNGDDESNMDDLGIHERLYGLAQQAIAVTIKSLPESSEFLGIFGTSVGAVQTAMAIGHRTDFNAAFVVTGGGPMPSVVANSTQDILIRTKEHRKKMYGFKNENDYEEALKKVIRWNPVRPPQSSAVRLGMVIGDKDTVVPAVNQNLLFEAWQPEVVYHFGFDHKLSIILTWLFRSGDIVNFFVKASFASARK